MPWTIARSLGLMIHITMTKEGTETIYTNLPKSIYINVKGLIVGLNITAYSFTECTPHVMRV